MPRAALDGTKLGNPQICELGTAQDLRTYDPGTIRSPYGQNLRTYDPGTVRRGTVRRQRATKVRGSGQRFEPGDQVTPLASVRDTRETHAGTRNDRPWRLQETIERVSSPDDCSAPHSVAVIIATGGAGYAADQSAMARAGAVPIGRVTADAAGVKSLTRDGIAGKRRRRREQGQDCKTRRRQQQVCGMELQRVSFPRRKKLPAPGPDRGRSVARPNASPHRQGCWLPPQKDRG